MSSTSTSSASKASDLHAAMLVSPQQIRQLSGLEFLGAIVAGRVPPPPIGVTLDFALVEVRAGEAVFEGNPRIEFYNPIGSVHGGYAATLLDSCTSCAVHSTLQAGQTYTTVEFKVNLVRAITTETGKIRAVGKVVHAGRQIATAEGSLLDGRGKLLAHGLTTCIILNASA